MSVDHFQHPLETNGTSLHPSMTTHDSALPSSCAKIVAFKEFKLAAEMETGLKVKQLRSDNGGEYINVTFLQFLKEHGIQLETSTPETPEQNGLSERKNRTIVECTRTMLHANTLPQGFWAKAINTTVYLINRSPTNIDSSESNTLRNLDR